VKGGDQDNSVTLRLAADNPQVVQFDVGADGTPEFSFARTSIAAIDLRRLSAPSAGQGIRADRHGSPAPDSYGGARRRSGFPPPKQEPRICWVSVMPEEGLEPPTRGL
jgi:hypothetical protein